MRSKQLLLLTLMLISVISISFTKVKHENKEVTSHSESEPLKGDRIVEDIDINFYDTSNIFERNWAVNQTFAFMNSKKTFTDSTVIEICNVFHDFAYPIKNRLNSDFGYRRSGFHKGIDIKLERGDTIVAAFDGKVRYSKYNTGGFGNLVIIRHHNGLETYYAHLTDLLIEPNEYVKAGDVIGTGGNTGARHSGPHLHFEVRIEDKPINPEAIFDSENYSLKEHNLVLTKDIFSPRGLNSKGEEKHTHGSKGTKGNIYYVRSGDSLSVIARRNKTSVRNLCKLNGLTETSVLQIGQRLKVH